MKRILVAVSFLMIALSTSYGQTDKKFVLLPSSEVKSFAKLYPQTGPHKISGAWQPSQSQIEALDKHLSHLSELTSGGTPNGRKIGHPEGYFRQYLAVIRGGKDLIYVNAFCAADEFPSWRSHLSIVSDGGNCFWQAWYDPATEEFFNLSINGRA